MLLTLATRFGIVNVPSSGIQQFQLTLSTPERSLQNGLHSTLELCFKCWFRFKCCPALKTEDHVAHQVLYNLCYNEPFICAEC